MTQPTPPIGFKDWALIAAALAQGRQSLILRKGGIAEGRDGFRFKHEEFFLFPTGYHQQAAKVRPEELAGLRPPPAAAEGTVRIDSFFSVERAVWIEDWETVRRLAPFHVWSEDAIRERFAYDDTAGLQCAVGRVWRLEQPWEFPDRPAYGGCRSWVTLPEPPPGLARTPALDDERHAARMHSIFAALGEPIPA